MNLAGKFRRRIFEWSVQGYILKIISIMMKNPRSDVIIVILVSVGTFAITILLLSKGVGPFWPPTQDPMPVQYSVVETEDLGSAGRMRISVRVIIEDKNASNQQIKLALLDVARKQNADAVMAYGFWPGDDWSWIQTAGRLEWGKNGTGWSPDSSIPAEGKFDPRAATKPLTHPRIDDPTKTSLTTEQIVDKSEAAVALIVGKTGSGTGFLVDQDILITNSHVISNEFINDLRISFPSGPISSRERQKPRRLLYESRRRDLALLLVSTSNAPLGLASGFQFKRGTDVVIIGNPSIGGESILPNAITRGILSTLYTHEGQSFYQLSASVNHGNSGGPVIDLTGRVIGITSSKAKNEEGIAFCIPVEDMLSAVSKVQSASALEKERATSLHRVSVIIYHLKQFQVLLYNTSIGYANNMRMMAQNGSLKGCDRASAKDFHEIRVVFTRGVA